MKRISFLFTVLLCMLLPVSVYAAAEAGMFDADARLTVTELHRAERLMFPFLSSTIILQYKMLIMLKTEQ